MRRINVKRAVSVSGVAEKDRRHPIQKIKNGHEEDIKVMARKRRRTQ